MKLWLTPMKTGHKWHQKMYHRTVGSGNAVPNIRTVDHRRNKKKLAKHMNELGSYMTSHNVTRRNK